MRVGILGCTGLVGQKYVSLLHAHPFFEIGFLAASEKNTNKSIYGMPISPLEKIEAANCDLFFSALPSKVAPPIETKLAKMGKWVISSSSAFRTVDDIPLIIPEINSEDLSLLDIQRIRLQINAGGIVAKPNCTLQTFLLPLYPLHKMFGLEKVVVTNLQALSGAGKRGLTSLPDTVDPYIPFEEEKTETEPKKILKDPSIVISSNCVRVPVSHGHLSLVHATFREKISLEECLRIWRSFPGLSLPLSPKNPIEYIGDEHRPQPLLDRERGGGMVVSVGRLRECSIHSIKFVALSHNLIRGAAGGGVLIAECIAQKEQWHDFTQSPLCKSL